MWQLVDAICKGDKYQYISSTDLGNLVNKPKFLDALKKKGIEGEQFERVIWGNGKLEVKEGSKVQVKIDAYPYGKYGMVNGTISKMGRVAEYDEQEGYYFPAEVELGSYDKQKIILMDGMTCNVEVNIGKRRIIEFVLEPIIEALRKSVKEK